MLRYKDFTRRRRGGTLRSSGRYAQNFQPARSTLKTARSHPKTVRLSLSFRYPLSRPSPDRYISHFSRNLSIPAIGRSRQVLPIHFGDPASMFLCQFRTTSQFTRRLLQGKNGPIDNRISALNFQPDDKQEKKQAGTARRSGLHKVRVIRLPGTQVDSSTSTFLQA